MKKSNLTKEQLEAIQKPFTEVPVLCKYCKKTIHLDEWGGVQNNEFFHKKCFENYLESEINLVGK